MALSSAPRLRRWGAVLLVGGAALASVACGAAHPFAEARTLAPVRAPEAPDMREEPEAFETALLARVNADRAAHGLRPLVFDPELVAVARARAAAQLPGEALSHAAPVALRTAEAGAHGAPLAFQRLLQEAGVRYGVAGENLARPRVAPEADAAETAALAHRALMASETHRQNILDPAYDRLAVGAMRGADGRIVYAQLFRGA